MHLGVGFLKQGQPQFSASGLGKRRLALGVARNQFIDCHFLPASVFAKFDSVQTLLVVSWSQEQASDQIWVLSEN